MNISRIDDLSNRVGKEPLHRLGPFGPAHALLPKGSTSDFAECNAIVVLAA